MHVIPAIDVLGGRVVRLHKGDYNEAVSYALPPEEQAAVFVDAGFKYLHIVDLDGAKEGEFKNLSIISGIIQRLGVDVQTGGGVRTFENVQNLLASGVKKVICSSMVMKNEPDWLRALHTIPENMILGMDIKDGKMAYSGWLETSGEAISDLLNRMSENGLQEVLCTDISKDGTLSGPNFKLYEAIKKEFPHLRLIASGGVSGSYDLEKLENLGIDAVVVGKAYYEGKISLKEMNEINLRS